MGILKSIGQAIVNAISGLGALLGELIGLGYWVWLRLVNSGKDRKKLSTCLQSVLSPYFPLINLNDVEVVPHANQVVKEAVTQQYRIYWEGPLDETNEVHLGLLIHELVHVTQYKELGTFFFYLLYSWEGAATASYENISYEVEAHEYSSYLMSDVGIYDTFMKTCHSTNSKHPVLYRQDIEWVWLTQ